MDSLKMHSKDITKANIEKIAILFPNCITETQDEHGRTIKAIDFDLLRQEPSKDIVDGPQERYQLNWPGKRQALLTANAPIAKTLRPCMHESVDFDKTQNLFIEGDNLDALKLLQETYLGKIKMIYIDPPYNTGADFIYKDDFSESSESYLLRTGQKNDEGNRLETNTNTDGRYHSNWLSMIFPRIKLTKNLLRDNGVIFISIHDKEVHNLRKILDEIYGGDNFVACLIWDKNHSAQAGVFKVYHEYILVYAKNILKLKTPTTLKGELFEAGAMKRESRRHPSSEFSFPAGVRFEALNGTELNTSWGETEKVELISGRMLCENGKTKEPVTLKAPWTQKNQMQQYFYGDRDNLFDSRGQKIVEFYFNSSGKLKIVKKRGVETPQTTLKDYGTQGSISTNLANLFELNQTPIDNPKPVRMLQDFISWFAADDQDIVLDFFAGSATTANAVLLKNAEDGIKRKFIMVQLPEPCTPNSVANNAGYQTIAEISKERIRRAGTKLKEDNTEKEGIDKLDTGFRVLKVDSSNMADVYYTSKTIHQDLLAQHIDNVKVERTPEDILFQVLLDWGVDLTLPIEKRNIHGHEVLFVDGDALVACFDNDGKITEEFVKELTQYRPLRVVFRDAGFASDSVKINVTQIFKQLSPHTEVKTI